MFVYVWSKLYPGIRNTMDRLRAIKLVNIQYKE
jgi:hypothetical protein